MLSRRALVTGAGLSMVAAMTRPSLAIGLDHGTGLDAVPADWIADASLDFSRAHAAAAKTGRHFVVLVEHPGCAACVRMRESLLPRADLRAYLRDNFTILGLNIIGKREAIDFDGTAHSESETARNHSVSFTPTLIFFADAASGSTGRPAEIARVQGYLPPFHFYQFFEWVRSDAWKAASYRHYSTERMRELALKGIEPENWALR